MFCSHSFLCLFQNNYAIWKLKNVNQMDWDMWRRRHLIKMNKRYCSIRKCWNHLLLVNVNIAYVRRNTLWVRSFWYKYGATSCGQPTGCARDIGLDKVGPFVCSSEDRRHKDLMDRQRKAAQLADTSFKLHGIWNIWKCHNKKIQRYI